MSDWADEKALEWLVLRCDHELCAPEKLCPECSQGQTSLAALLRKVEERCLQDFTSEEPCPQCGLGVSTRCYGCQMVEQRKALLAEVRRVVGEERERYKNPTEGCIAVRQFCREILSRLEKL